ncbi:MAG: tol-pal system protein YbgF [Labilithrix sp.]|nr:tol-pal system protein YbgF [Labilithrix sp.]MCW5835249.1 tol-pal system protein YbgF [Labilithrix sp.]
MREVISKVQAEQDRTNERVGLLESAAEERAARPRKAAPAAPLAAPRTVQIGDTDDGHESDDPNDPNARPEIRLQGQGGGSVRPVRGKSSSGKGEARVDFADDATGSGEPRPPILDPEAKRSYDNALSLVNAKQYDRALEALAGFLVRWPDHPYAENALYWRGEVYFARGEHLRAAEQFEAVLARFGGGNKAPDALLKIGMCHDRLGSADRAKEYWDRLRRDFPRSDAAKKIPQPSSEDSRGRGVGPKESR